jgi:hypothetical protein
MNAPGVPQRRRIFRRLSIVAGNTIQFIGLTAAIFLLDLSRRIHSKPAATVTLAAAWVLLYFCCHAIAHWAVGRVLGIRFAFYTVGGTGNPSGYPGVMRLVFDRLPFFGVQTEKASMQNTSPTAKAAMWTAGVTSSIVVPTLGAVYAWSRDVPGSKLFLIFAAFWAVGTWSSNWRSQTGDYAKARRALHPQLPARR